MSFEVVEESGVRYAEIIWADTTVAGTTFYSPVSSSFQFGLLAHAAGFAEPAHSHHTVKREITDMQQMFVVQRGVVAVYFHSEDGSVFREVQLSAGDAINLINGVHSLRVVEDMQCISVKQGPFLGDGLDKIDADVR